MVFDPGMRRLSAAYESATGPERAAGRAWYPNARRAITRLSRETGFDRDLVAGVVAVLSPGCAWSRNVSSARIVLGAVARGENIMEVRGVTAYRRNIEKAARVAAGDVTEIKGIKVDAFWRALCGSDDVSTIDRHGIAVYYGRPVAKPSRAMVRKVQAAFDSGASRVGEKRTIFQATLWVVQKGKS